MKLPRELYDRAGDRNREGRGGLAVVACLVVLGCVVVSLPGERRANGGMEAGASPLKAEPQFELAQFELAQFELATFEWAASAPLALRPALLGPDQVEPGAEVSAPMIAIVIDDLGIDGPRTLVAIGLPAAVSLSFLPYGAATPDLSREAHARGHEVMVHLPMAPIGSENPGPMALQLDHSEFEIERRLNWALSRVANYEGVNNHMGSAFTTSPAALVPVMRILAGRQLYFLDSRTTPESEAEDVAHQAGVLAGGRDVFLDDQVSLGAIETALAQVEALARKRGSAIAVGHPHTETLSALKDWVVEIEARGFRLVPVSAVLKLRNRATENVSKTRLLPAARG